MKLVIGNKNYSSWSLRAWLLLQGLGIPFEEEKLSFNDPTFKSRILKVNPAGMVPVLVDDDVVVWDTFAIVEYVAEKYPSRGVWPVERVARARARSICAEMHSGFTALRDRLHMNCEAHLPMPVLDHATKRDVARICDIWAEAARFAPPEGGPFLFGKFSAADAYFAPVVSRFVTYDVAIPATARAYVAAIEALPAMREWVTAARAENDFYPPDEPYRGPPAARVEESED
jgi:glutathione S-transferase